MGNQPDNPVGKIQFDLTELKESSKAIRTIAKQIETSLNQINNSTATSIAKSKKEMVDLRKTTEAEFKKIGKSLGEIDQTKFNASLKAIRTNVTKTRTAVREDYEKMGRGLPAINTTPYLNSLRKIVSETKKARQEITSDLAQIAHGVPVVSLSSGGSSSRRTGSGRTGQINPSSGSSSSYFGAGMSDGDVAAQAIAARNAQLSKIAAEITRSAEREARAQQKIAEEAEKAAARKKAAEEKAAAIEKKRIAAEEKAAAIAQRDADRRAARQAEMVDLAARHNNPIGATAATMGGYAQRDFTGMYARSSTNIVVASGNADRARHAAQLALESANAELLRMQERFRGLRAEFPKLPVRDIDAMRTAFSNARQPIVDIQARMRAIRGELNLIKNNPLELGRVEQLTDELKVLEGQLKNQVLAGVRGLDAGLERLRQRGWRNLEAISGQLQKLSQALLPVAAAAGGAAFFGVQSAARQERIEMRYRNIMPDVGAAESSMRRLSEAARAMNAPVLQTLDALLLYAPTIGSNADEMDRLLNLTIRLASIDPGTGDGVRGAAFAINEALSSTFNFERAMESGKLEDLGGDLLSLTERFGLSRRQLRESILQEGDFITGLDAYLEKIGASTQAALDFGRTFQGAMTIAGGSIQDVLATAFEPLSEMLAKIIHEFSMLLSNLNETAPGAVRVAGSIISMTAAAAGLIVAISAIISGIDSIKLAFAGIQAAGLLDAVGLGAVGLGPIMLAIAGITAALALVGEMFRRVDEEAQNAAEQGLQQIVDKLNEVGVYGTEGNRFDAQLSGNIHPNQQIGIANQAVLGTGTTLESRLQHLVDLLKLMDSEWLDVNIPSVTPNLTQDGVQAFLDAIKNGTLTVDQLVTMMKPEYLLQLSQSMLGAEDALTMSLAALAQTSDDIIGDAEDRIDELAQLRQRNIQRSQAQLFLQNQNWYNAITLGMNVPPGTNNAGNIGRTINTKYTGLLNQLSIIAQGLPNSSVGTTNAGNIQGTLSVIRSKYNGLLNQLTLIMQGLPNPSVGTGNAGNIYGTTFAPINKGGVSPATQLQMNSDPVGYASSWLQSNAPDAVQFLTNLFNQPFELIGQMVETGAQNQKEAARAAITRMNQIQDEFDDFIRNRLRQDAAFKKQLAQFDTAAAEAEQAIIDQINDLQNESNEQQIDAIQEFHDQEAELLEDHLNNLNRIRRDASDELEDALASRNMSAIFRAVRERDKRLKDAQDEFDLQKKRREEDLQELIKNLNEQRDERIADYLEQLQKLRANNVIRRAEMIQDFYDRRTLEDEDRRIRLQREQRDLDLAQQWREADQLQQVLDLISHNNTVRTFMSAGFSIIEGMYQQHMNNLALMVSGASTPSSPLPPSGITPLPYIPPFAPLSSRLMDPLSSSRGGTMIIAEFSVPIEVNGLFDSRVIDQVVARAKGEIIPAMAERLDKVMRENS